jgi:DNA polymerase-3 subunit epsilon
MFGSLRGQPRERAVQRSFEDLGTPLSEVTFVVIDLETTGGSPSTDRITEVGAVKVRGGELLGKLQTLVNPGAAIPPAITVLTGITQAMVLPAPRIEEILETIVHFIGDAVVVGHNVRFDLGFLRAAMEREGWPRLPNTAVDTCALARRLVREEVPNCKLHTLAEHLGASHRPTHRALDDALATTDVLHSLLERAGTLGVLGLEDLVALPTVGGHPQLGKLVLTRALPRAPGIYIFRDHGGRPLYVGKAADLRRRVRSYFTGDGRRKIGPLLRELTRIDHVVCGSELEASVLEVRTIHALLPRYNRTAKNWQRYAYVKLTLDEPWPRLSIVRQPRAGDGCIYVGPVGSARTARTVADAIETAMPLRRCTTRLPVTVTARRPPCMPAQLGVAACPCAGTMARVDYEQVVQSVVRGLTDEPDLLLDPLRERMARLSADHRYEEAADVRDRAGALTRALERQRRYDALRRAGTIELEIDGQAAVVLNRGLLVPGQPGDPGPVGTPVPRQLADELATVITWIDTRIAPGRVELRSAISGLAWPAIRLPSFQPRQRGTTPSLTKSVSAPGPTT